MSEINWFQIVLDYGRRFPNKEVNELIPQSMNECKFSRLLVYKSGKNSKYVHLTNEYNNCVFSTTSRDGAGELKYFHIDKLYWTKVPDNVLLRLLTEGKEDLI